jgi:peroxiredoxin
VKRNPLVLVVVALVATLMLYFGFHMARRSGAGPGPRIAKSTVAPDFSLESIDGKTVKLSDLRGKAVLLNFWATWCGPCKIEIPWFIEFNKTYKARGLAVVGVSMDEDGWKSVKPYLATKKIDYPIVVGTEDVAKAYGGVDSLPSTFIIDRDGKIAFSHSGLVGKDTYETEIRSLLEGGKVAVAAAR